MTVESMSLLFVILLLLLQEEEEINKGYFKCTTETN